MSIPYPIPVTAVQVGTYFVRQYYQLLQRQPDFIYHFYGDASTLVRIDGTNRVAATTMPQIHALIMSLNYTGIEVSTAHALESWSGGVLVMVSGSVQGKGFSVRRKFVETFFLAPQEKGYFVLNDVFHFTDEEPIQHHPAVLLAQSNLEAKLCTQTAVPDTVSNYLLGGEMQAREFVAPANAKGNGLFDNYSFPEEGLKQTPDLESILEENLNSAEELNSSIQNIVNAALDHLPASVEEPAAEPQKHTYASILRAAKGQAAPSVVPQHSVSKNTPPSSEWTHAPQSFAQQATAMLDSLEGSGADAVEEVSVVEDDEIRSVYVRNLLPSVSEAEIEDVFKNFGKIASEGVVIRSRKDVGICYAFVEFEDTTGVHNAVKAGSAQVAGRQVYIEERRPNSNIPSRAGRGRGRGRGSYQTDASREWLRWK